MALYALHGVCNNLPRDFLLVTSRKGFVTVTNGLFLIYINIVSLGVHLVL